MAGSPNDAIAHYHLALVKEQDGDRPGALTLAQQALALDEKFVGRTACQELVQRLKGTK